MIGIFAALLVVGSASAFLDGEIGREVQEIVPLDVRVFYEQLNNNDKDVLKKVLSKGSTYNNMSEVLTDLRNGSSFLYDKAVSVVTDLRTTVAALSPPARSFIDETVEQVKKALGESFSLEKVKAEANLVVARYRTLDEPAKEELKTSFPMVSGIIFNNVFQTLASGLLGIGTD